MITHDELQRRNGKALRNRAKANGEKFKNINDLSNTERYRIRNRIDNGRASKFDLCQKFCVTYSELNRALDIDLI